MNWIDDRLTFWRIVKQGSTEDFSGLPYVCTLQQASLWVYYGITKPGATLVATGNSVGVVMEIIYVTLFLIYAPPRIRVSPFHFHLVVFLFTAIIINSLKYRPILVSLSPQTTYRFLFWAKISVSDLLFERNKVKQGIRDGKEKKMVDSYNCYKLLHLLLLPSLVFPQSLSQTACASSCSPFFQSLLSFLAFFLFSLPFSPLSPPSHSFSPSFFSVWDYEKKATWLFFFFCWLSFIKLKRKWFNFFSYTENETN